MHAPDSPDTSPTASQEPLRVVLELARATRVDDPYAFQFTPQSYIVHTPGGGFAAAEMPWDAELLTDLQTLREPRWEPALVQRFGERLRRFLGGTGWPLEEQRIVEAVRRGQPTILTIRSAAAELYALPWELVTIKATGQHLGELPDFVVRYEWPDTATVREQAVERGRILFAWSAAAGAVPASEHLAAIQDACAASRYPFDPAADVLAHASCERLVATLRAAAEQQAPFTVLHLLCHGAAHGQTFGLALSAGDDAGLVVVDAGRLRQLLAPFAATLRLVVLAACDGGNAGELGNHLGSVAQTLHRAGLQVVLASRFPLSTAGSIRLTRTLYDRLLVRREPAERAVAAARADLARDPTRLDWAALQYYARLADGDATHPLFVPPYRGLAPFRAEHAWAYFGREVEAAELRARILEAHDRGAPRFVVVAGAAGVGKTSLIQAGLVPAVAAVGWRTIAVAPGPAPFAELADALAGLTGGPVAPDADGARAALATWQRAHPGRALLIVVDPLEELFAQTPELAQRVRFVRLLWSLARDPSLRVSVVVALRIDFIGRCGELVLDERSDLRLDQVAYDADHRVFVAQLGVPQLRDAISRPARAVGVDFDPGLTERIVAEVAGQPGALPMLQHALKLLWKQRRERRLTLAAYDAIGGVGGALERHAEGILQRLSPEQLRQARRTLVRLASAPGEAGCESRRRVPLDQLQPNRPGEAEAFREALARLIAARLVVLDEQTGPRGAGKQATAELVHEALLHRWQRLRAWVREDSARVVELLKVELWVHEWQDHGSLLDEQRLGYALEVAGKYGDDLPAEATALIDRSREDIAAAHAAEATRGAELEGLLGATQDLLHAADEDMLRAEAELVRLRRLLRLAAALVALCVAWALLAAALAASATLERARTTVDELIRPALCAGRAGGQP